MAHRYKSCFCGVIVDAIKLVCFWSKFSNIVVRADFSRAPTLFKSFSVILCSVAAMVCQWWCC